MFRTHQTAIRMPCTRVLYLVKSNIANSKFHKIFEVKMHLKYVLDWAFLIKPAEWFAIFSNIRGSGSRRLSNIVRGERCSFKIAFPENSCFCCQHFRNTFWWLLPNIVSKVSLLWTTYVLYFGEFLYLFSRLAALIFITEDIIRVFEKLCF